MSGIRVAILRGGPSAEYGASMMTGSGVLAAIDRTKYEPIDVIITKNGEWLVEGYARFPEQVLSNVDVAFIALHGTYGEDGSIQRFLERLGVPYNGSKSFPSAVAIHKVITKDSLRNTGIKMAPHMVVTRGALERVHDLSSNITKMFGPQYVIKPVNSGSSVGTMMVTDPNLLSRAINDALEVYDQVLVEKRIVGREATCGVLERFRNEGLYALPPIEIVPPPKAQFFSQDVKYTGETEEICPGRFTHNEKREIERIAKLVHTTLDLSQYSRSDFMVAPEGIYFLEVNTLPGLTNESLFPKAMTAVGSSYRALIEHLLSDALDSR